LRRTGFLLDERFTQRLIRALELELATGRHDSAKALVRELDTTPLDGALWRRVISHVAIGETYFFRDAAQMAALRKHVLPKLIAAHASDRQLALWSIGCASGEEPYSIAILLAEVLDHPAAWNIEIIGSDLDQAALQRARRGLYRPWSFRHTSPGVLARYFKKEGNLYRLDPRIRKMVGWHYINLANPAFEAPFAQGRQPDLILCRNVLIYMAPEIADAAAERLEELLKPGGWLLVAAVELGAARFGRFEAVRLQGVTAYRKPCKALPGAAHQPRVPNEKAPRRGRGGSESPSPSRAQWVPDAFGAFEDMARTPRAPARPPNARPVSEVAHAIALLRAGHRDEALGLLAARSDGGPEAAAATAVLAEIATDADELEDAARLAHRAIELDPFQPAPYYVLGTIALNDGALDEAVLNLRRTLYLDPGFVSAHFGLAAVAEKIGHPRTAHRHRHMARELLLKMAPNEPVPGHPGLSAGEMLATMEADSR